jgi:hypothetical protein
MVSSGIFSIYRAVDALNFNIEIDIDAESVKQKCTQLWYLNHLK